MKHLFLVCSAFLLLYACGDSASKNEAQSPLAADSTAIAGQIHGFYQWYDKTVNANVNTSNFVVTVDGHYALDLSLMDQYYASFNQSGFVSPSFIDGEMDYFKVCEKLWLNEAADGPPLGMDADKYFCGQDWDIKYFTESPLKIYSIEDNKASVALVGKGYDGVMERKFELVKIGDKWLIEKIECDMGMNSYLSEAKMQAEVEAAAAFYTGYVPCPDCDGIQTLLTLNADKDRTFSMEEQYNGRRTDRIETSGTWTVSGKLVTLNDKSGSKKFNLTETGLIPLNPDGQPKNQKYLLTKVLGE